MQIGRKIGVKIRIAGVGSMKVPTNSRMILINSPELSLLVVGTQVGLHNLVYRIVENLLRLLRLDKLITIKIQHL